jgi:HD-like signal output (HDOD) protein
LIASRARAFLEEGILSTLPGDVFRVLERCNAPAVDLRGLAAAIESDPYLVSQLLKTANSALFGMGPVTSVARAIAVMGVRSVQVLVLGFSLLRILQRATEGGTDRSAYWRRSLTMAVASRRIAIRSRKVRIDEAFIGGLLCDAGIAAACAHPSGVYDEVLSEQKRTGEPVCDVERRHLGVTHAEISAELLRLSGADGFLCETVAAHHGEGLQDLTERKRHLATVFWSADHVAEILTESPEPIDLERIRRHAVSLASSLSIDPDETFMDMNAHVLRLAETLRVNLSDEITQEMVQSARLSELLIPEDPQARESAA